MFNPLVFVNHLIKQKARAANELLEPVVFFKYLEGQRYFFSGFEYQCQIRRRDNIEKTKLFKNHFVESFPEMTTSLGTNCRKSRSLRERKKT